MTKYLTEEEIRTLWNFAHDLGSWSTTEAINAYIEKHNKPSYETGKVYKVTYCAEYKKYSQYAHDWFAEWSGRDFRNAEGRTLGQILGKDETLLGIIKAEKVND